MPGCRRSVEELFRLRVERQAAPSSVFAVFTPDGIAASGGCAQQGAAPTPDTAYRIASCTKSFTAAALLLLRDRGALSLDDPVDAHLAVGPFTGPTGDRAAAPTLRMLASMSGGLPTDDPWADRQESLAPQAFDALVARGVRLAGPPGSRYEYSNLGFALLGRVVERVTGRSYPSFVTEELLCPLGLDGAAYDERVPAADRVARGHQRVDGAWVEQPFSAPGAFSAIGGLFATPRSLARWASWLAAAFRDDGAPGPLAPASRREMQQGVQPIPAPGPGVAAWGYGYGLVVERTERHGVVVSHSGGYPGFGSHVRWHPASGVGVVALENATYSDVGAAAATALRTVLDEIVVPDAVPVLWPETVRARDAVEVLVRGWDDDLAAWLLADNVALDEPLDRRRERLVRLAAEAGVGAGAPVPLAEASPHSDSPAHLAWTVPGSRGSLRCEVRLTPEEPPRVQTLAVRHG